MSLKLRGLKGAADVEDEAATFEQLPDADSVEFRSIGVGLKEAITLSQAPSVADPPTYVYDVDASEGLTPRLAVDGSVEFVDAADAVQATIPIANLTDSAEPLPAYSTQVTYALSPNGASWRLTMAPSIGWLTDPERVYPVVLDPPLLFQKLPVMDCSLVEEQYWSTFCASNGLWAGRVTAGQRRRAILYFTMSGMPAGASITHANVQVWQDGPGTINPGNHTEYAAYPIKAGWTNSASWGGSGYSAWAGGPGGTLGAVAPDSRQTLSAASVWRYFNITDLATGWYQGSLPNSGIALKQTGPETTNNVVAFISSEYYGYDPTLNIRYTLPGSGFYRTWIEYEDGSRYIKRGDTGEIATTPASSGQPGMADFVRSEELAGNSDASGNTTVARGSSASDYWPEYQDPAWWADPDDPEPSQAPASARAPFVGIPDGDETPSGMVDNYQMSDTPDGFVLHGTSVKTDYLYQSHRLPAYIDYCDTSGCDNVGKINMWFRQRLNGGESIAWILTAHTDYVKGPWYNAGWYIWCGVNAPGNDFTCRTGDESADPSGVGPFTLAQEALYNNKQRIGRSFGFKYKDKAKFPMLDFEIEWPVQGESIHGLLRGWDVRYRYGEWQMAAVSGTGG